MHYDTFVIQTHSDEIEFPGNTDFDWSLEHVEAVIEQAISKSEFQVTLPLSFQDYSLLEVNPNKPWSKVGYIESNAGYFFVTQALTDHITVTYNRWD
ncbi:hypothetical protein WOC23_22440 [Vibrio parahaemolyticus]|nr:hypothetical protein [Vibrio parahaemolyticus]